MQWEVMHKRDRREFDNYDIPADEAPAPDRGRSRMHKINAYKRTKEATARYQILSERRKQRKHAGMDEGEFWDESLERELWLTQIAVSIRTTLDTLSSINSELPLAKRMDEMRRKS